MLLYVLFSQGLTSALHRVSRTVPELLSFLTNVAKVLKTAV